MHCNLIVNCVKLSQHVVSFKPRQICVNLIFVYKCDAISIFHSIFIIFAQITLHAYRHERNMGFSRYCAPGVGGCALCCCWTAVAAAA